MTHKTNEEWTGKFWYLVNEWRYAAETKDIRKGEDKIEFFVRTLLAAKDAEKEMAVENATSEALMQELVNRGYTKLEVLSNQTN